MAEERTSITPYPWWYGAIIRNFWPLRHQYAGLRSEIRMWIRLAKRARRGN